MLAFSEPVQIHDGCKGNYIVKHEDGQVKVAVPGEKRQKVALRLLTVEAREEAPLRLDSES